MGQKSSVPATTYSPDQLPPFFPKTSKECTDSASAFFKCFHEKTLRVSALDTDAGVRALAMCKEQKAAYEVCMQKTEKVKKPKLFRVQDEYRVNNTQVKSI